GSQDRRYQCRRVEWKNADGIAGSAGEIVGVKRQFEMVNRVAPVGGAEPLIAQDLNRERAILAVFDGDGGNDRGRSRVDHWGGADRRGRARCRYRIDEAADPVPGRDLEVDIAILPWQQALA